MSARFAPPDNEAMVGAFAQCVRHPNATPLTYHGTNSWILAAPDDGACLVVDPGPDDAACIGRIAEACARRGLTVAAVRRGGWPGFRCAGAGYGGGHAGPWAP